MSGIEITGLILAGFPLVISALEHYRDGFEPLQEWWKFESEFSSFIEELGTQKARFDLNLEKLLTPFVTSDAEMNTLLNEPGPDTWKDTVLLEQLRKRLGGSYEWYAAVCRKIIATLNSLERRLGIQDGEVRYIDASRWDHELQRLRISFSRKKFKHVALLSKYNDELQQLLSSNDELAPSRRRRKTPLLAILRCLQQNSQNLYNGLLKSWKCQCQLPHDTRLLLERRTVQDDSNDLRLHLLLQVQSVYKSVEIRMKDDSTVSLEPGKISSSPRGELLELKQQVKDRPKRISSSQSLKSSIAALLNGMGISSKNQAKTSTQKSRDQSPQPPPKTKKKARFETSPAPEIRIEKPKQIIQAEILDICSQLHQTHTTTKCLGSISIAPESRFYLYMDQSQTYLSSGNHCETITLADLLHTPDPNCKSMTRQQRFTLANILAFTVLQLQPTSWLTTTWNKHDIIFLRTGSSPNPVLSHPYIQKKFPAEATTKTMSAAGCKEALFRLGVLLLELTFNRSLESLPFRQKYLGRNGEPNEYTDLCTAKEWQREVEGECGEALSETIRRCIDCSFGPKPDWQSEEFLEAYFGNVVEPLKEILSQWEKNA